VTSGYERSSEPRDLIGRAAGLAAKSIVIDVEPLIASWDSSQETLDQGVAAMLDQVSEIEGLQAVCFATNSTRRPSAAPVGTGLRVVYLASARKPFRTAPYRNLPRPGVVIGDQPATDGLLARRLGYTFLHYCPPLRAAPIGPRLLAYGGRLVLPLLAGSTRPRADDHDAI
jgi:predicted HAD superfamily phosphohydrolase YqeG